MLFRTERAKVRGLAGGAFRGRLFIIVQLKVVRFVLIWPQLTSVDWPGFLPKPCLLNMLTISGMKATDKMTDVAFCFLSSQVKLHKKFIHIFEVR